MIQFDGRIFLKWVVQPPSRLVFGDVTQRDAVTVPLLDEVGNHQLLQILEKKNSDVLKSGAA